MKSETVKGVNDWVASYQRDGLSSSSFFVLKKLDMSQLDIRPCLLIVPRNSLPIIVGIFIGGLYSESVCVDCDVQNFLPVVT